MTLSATAGDGGVAPTVPGSARCGEESANPTTNERTYLLANAADESVARFAGLSALFDSATIRHLTHCGVASGWRCLEAGAGGGSIATWLADRVGDTGSVLATDIDPRFLHPLARPNLAVRRHDLAIDPLPESTFDLVHARLVLLHLPQRKQAMERLIRALKPGGWIVVEEFDSVSMVCAEMQCAPLELLQTQLALLRLLEDHGVDRLYGRRLFGELRSHGLVNLEAEGRVALLRHGSPGPSMLRANYEQTRDAMIKRGYITREQFEADLARVQDAEFAMPSPLMWSVCGQRP